MFEILGMHLIHSFHEPHAIAEYIYVPNKSNSYYQNVLGVFLSI